MENENNDQTKIKIIYSEKYLGYKFGPGHPFLSKRREEFVNLLKDESDFKIIKPFRAKDEDILLIHTKDYLSRLKTIAIAGGGFLSTDTPINSDILDASYYYVGGTIRASQISLKEGLAVNSLGGLHHAGKDESSGFCVFNDHSVAIRKLQIEGFIKKAAVLDLDVHAGNGTQDIFYDDPSVLKISIHQDPYDFYPGTGFSWQKGSGKGEGYTINYPMPIGTREKEYLAVLRKALYEVDKFKPEISFIVFGVDTYKKDQLGGFRLEKDTYARIAKILNKYSPKVILFAGGYSSEVPRLWLEIVNNLNNFHSNS